MHTPLRDRLTGGLGAAIMVALLGAALLRGLGVEMGMRPDEPVVLLNLRALPVPPPRLEVERPRARPARHAPSPRNLKNQATPVVAPPTVIPPRTPPPVIAALKPGIGAAPSAGASDRAGPGQGAGGEGDGTGGGGDGDGDFTPPRQTKGRLSYSDIPADLRETGIEASVAVRYRVGSDGRTSRCEVTKSSGYPALDTVTCALIERRFRFEPSRDPDGRPVQSTIVETHSWGVDRSDYAPRS